MIFGVQIRQMTLFRGFCRYASLKAVVLAAAYCNCRLFLLKYKRNKKKSESVNL